jgi:lipopolysaccharide export system protein LptA
VRWQKSARLVIAVMGVGVAVALFVLRRERAPVTTSSVKIETQDKAAKMETGVGQLQLTDIKTGKPRGSVEFGSSRHYEDGRSHYTKIHIKRTDEPPFELWADSMDLQGRSVNSPSIPAEAFLVGNVRLKTDDGLELTTDRATYVDANGLVTMPNDVSFVRGRLSGKGFGAIYNRDAQTFQFLDQARAEVAPDPQGKGKASASSKTMLLMRGKKSLLLDQAATIVTETDTLAGDVATMYFTEDEQSIRYLELRSRASVTPLTPDTGTPEMHADNITLTFQPDGRTLQHATLVNQASVVLTEAQLRKSISGSRIDVTTGPDGRTLTRLEAQDKVVVVLPPDQDTPARTIRAASLTASGDEKAGLNAAVFDKDVSFEEQRQPAGAPPKRTRATAAQLVLRLKGRLDAIEAAEFRQNVEFVDGTMTARADWAEYKEAQGLLTLKQAERAPRRIPNVTDTKVQVDANVIEINTSSHDLKATGGVRTVTQPDPDAAGKRPAGLFNDKEPVRGLAETFVYTNASGKAIYTGTPAALARLFQGKSEVLGDEVRLDDASQNLDAFGRVNTTFEMTVQQSGQTTSAKPAEYHVTASVFHYDDAKRTATYEGQDAPVVMKSTDGETVGRLIRLLLAKEGRSLEQMHVEGGKEKFFAQMPGGYEATGEVLDYEVATDIYVLSGKPVLVKSPRQAQPGAKGPAQCDLTRGLKIVLNRKDGSVRVLDQGGVPGGTDSMPCDQSLRTIR